MKAGLESYRAALERAARALAGKRVDALFATEPERLRRTTLSAAGLYLDFSKQLVDLPSLALLRDMADAAGIDAARAAMFRGETINVTEQRAVLHTALRNSAGGPADTPHAREIQTVLAAMGTFVDAVRGGQRRGYGGAPFTDVVNIGIGGSHLGPQLACDALRYLAGDGLRAHFLANVDGGEFDRITATLDPSTTLFIVASKSFTTIETRLNANSARAWLASRHADPAAVSSHFVAVSARPDRAIEFGIDADNVFPMWDWVGGRYSMWSAIGLPIALSFGNAVLAELHAGAAAMDNHFLTTAPAANLPVTLALLGIWNTNFLGAESYAVVPYDDRLRYLPDYLQQLEMESNGKRVTLTGDELEHHSAPVTWGGLGTNAQHAFFQLLHQGTRLIPIDFIVAMRHPARRSAHHDLLVANCFAQAEGLMRGRSYAPQASDAADLARHRATPGNRPNTMLCMEELTPATLGALLAAYEHKTFVQSVIWDINAFDQWGVELGKELATVISDEFGSQADAGDHDPSTAALIERYRQQRS